MKTTLGTESLDDTSLVALSQKGDREAFGRIVERYQSLICALTYSACGNLQSSEDLAQVTFITAWCQLARLREPGQLKSWLCGIARNVANNSFRRDKRTPTANAETLEAADDLAANAATPRDYVINQEEEAILWRSLGELPLTYREPLVLFYRQRQSVPEVAEALQVSEDVVRQRLSRGRAMLTEQVARFVETALQHTGPTHAFTLSVVAALPVMTASMKAAVIGATAAKGSAAAKSAGLVGLFNAVLGPLAVFLGTYFGYKLDRDTASSPQSRSFVVTFYRVLIVCVVAFILAMESLAVWGRVAVVSYPTLYAGLCIGLCVAYTLLVLALSVWGMRRHYTLRKQEVSGDTARSDAMGAHGPVPLFEYRSKLSLLGLPFVHIRLRGGLERGPVMAWIAAGDAAIGAIFAFGGIAVAPISSGGLAVGLLVLGGLGVGVAALAGVGLGFWAMGGFAIGGQAFGGCAVGRLAAEGGVAVAREFAQGGVALGRHANDAAAQTFFQNSTFHQVTLVVLRHCQWLTLIWLLPLVLWWRVVRNRRPRQDSARL